MRKEATDSIDESTGRCVICLRMKALPSVPSGGVVENYALGIRSAGSLRGGLLSTPKSGVHHEQLSHVLQR